VICAETTASCFTSSLLFDRRIQSVRRSLPWCLDTDAGTCMVGLDVVRVCPDLIWRCDWHAFDKAYLQVYPKVIAYPQSAQCCNAAEDEHRWSTARSAHKVGLPTDRLLDRYLPHTSIGLLMCRQCRRTPSTNVSSRPSSFSYRNSLYRRRRSFISGRRRYRDNGLPDELASLQSHEFTNLVPAACVVT